MNSQMLTIRGEGNFTVVPFVEPVPTYPLNTNRTEMATENFIDQMNLFTPEVEDSVIHPG